MNDQQRKTFETCRARLFLVDVHLRQIEGDDGRPEFIATEGPAMCRRFADLDQLERWTALRCGRREVAA